MFRTAVVAALFGVLVMAGCTQNQRQPAAAPTPKPSATLSSESPGAPALEWKPGSHSAAVVEHMQEFRQKRREQFRQFLLAYAASQGNVQYPRLARLKQSVLQWFLMSEDDYRHLPAYMKVFTGTGPYRRLITKPGYSYVAGNIFLPCKAARLHANFETAFAYVGGWGVGDAGKAVDAGFQRSDRFDDYAAFILAQDYHQISKYPRFLCGHTVAFSFYPPTGTELRFWTRGMTTNRRVETVVASLQHRASYGWPPNGGGPDKGIVLKRMTTIGQADAEEALPEGVAWDADGSYFGHYAKDRNPRVRWSEVMVGRVDAKGKAVGVSPWALDESNLTLKAGLLNYPSNPQNIWFTCTACPDESNAINLAGGEP